MADETNRNTAIDFVKGFLVISMIVYHSLNYFRQGSFALHYFRYIATGFIGMSGFLITNVIYLKYQADPRRLWLKQLSRGGKLVALFLLLNVLINSLVHRNYTSSEMGIVPFFNHLPTILLKGSSQFAAFEILLPIGYLLIIAPLLLQNPKRIMGLLFCCLLVLVPYCIITENGAYSSYNLFMLTFGFIGILVGLTPTGVMVNLLTKNKYLVLLAFFSYLSIATVTSPSFGAIITGTLSTIAVMFLFANRIKEKNVIKMEIVNMGRHSLMLYLVQIAILQLINRVIKHFDIGDSYKLIVGFLITLVLTTAIAIILRISLRKSTLIKNGYKFLFN
jgi:hypothetical protein